MKITSNPNVRGGIPCFGSTRIPVHYVLNHLGKGYSYKDLRKLFPEIPTKAIKDALQFHIERFK